VRKNILSILGLAALLTVAGCSATDNTNTIANTNANATIATDTTRPGPDDTVITTTTDASGVKTETRVFHNNPRVAKVVVTTRNGQRTTTVYAPSGTAKELKDDVGDALAATGNTLADAAGFVGDKAEDVAGKAVEGAKTVGNKTASAAETAADKTAEGAKTVAEKTAEGAKKTGKAIKKAVTP
jgi:hypothetical protein